jgi:hypothetical protein|mmetsp:Transcript_6655/g.6779  ORF Transcript_6655/g.6779 Transcript_6655/m.6779 type:complete len:218 (+) Transcript_6655:225-878(+)
MGSEQSKINDRDSEHEGYPAMSPEKISSVYNKVISSLENKRNIHSPGGRLRRAHSVDSTDEWGFFEDFEATPHYSYRSESEEEVHQEELPIQRALSLPPPKTAAPMYVLESTLATQQLWYSTAGLRPKQPQKEREYFENLYQRNFENSDIPGIQNSTNDLGLVDAVPKDIKPKDEVSLKEYDGEILFRGKGPFSNSVSKSFLDHDLAAMTLQVRFSL